MATMTLDDFLTKARPLNPDYSDSELIQAYQDRYGKAPTQTVSPAPLMTLDQFLPKARTLNPDYSDEELTAAWQEKYGARGAKEKDQGDFVRGGVTAFKQIPQTVRGLEAGAGAIGEKIAGEGGLFTALKEHGLKGYQEHAADIAKDSKPSDSVTDAYKMAKAGDPGALVDWLQYALGYGGGQALQMLATAGIGYAGGKLALQPAARTLAEKMIAKESARLAATGMAGEQLAKQAVSNVAARIGQIGALGSAAVGMEGGEIYGGLVEKAAAEGRSLTGEELAKATGATLGAGALEFVGDKIGLDLILGKSLAGKLVSSRLGHAAAAGSLGVATEGGTEFTQTLVEEFGKGNDPFSPESLKQAVDAAALGGVGGGAVGTAGGLMRRPEGDDELQVTDRTPPDRLALPAPPIYGEGPVYTPTGPVEEVRPGKGRLAALGRTIEPIDGEVLPPVGPRRLEGPPQPGEVRGGKVYGAGEVLDVSPLPDVSPILKAGSLDDAIASAVGVVQGATETAKARAAEFARMTAKAKNETDALLEKAPEKRPAFEVPTLPGPEAQPPTLLNQPSPIVPGQAFTPRPEIDDPRARLAEERARMVAQREQQRLQQQTNPVSEPVSPAPAVQPADEGPLPSQVDLAYPSAKQVRDLIHEKGLHLDTPVFREYLKMAVGKEKFGDLTPQELQKLAEKVKNIKAPQQPTQVQEAPPQVPLTPRAEKPYAPVTTIPEAQVPRSELTPEKNAEMLLRAEKAKADLEIAGQETGRRKVFTDNANDPGQTVTGLASAAPEWYTELQSGPGKVSADYKTTNGKRVQTKSAREKIEEAIQKIIKDQGADRGKAVEQVKAALLQDQEFHRTEWGRDLASILEGEWPSWVEKPEGVTQTTENAEQFQNVARGTSQVTVEEPKSVKVPPSRTERLKQQKQKMEAKKPEPSPSDAPAMESQPATVPPEREPAPPTTEAAPTTEEVNGRKSPISVPSKQETRATLPTMATDRGPGSSDSAQQPPEPGRSDFKPWFSGSKIVRDNGKPLTVYHYTDTKGLSSFDRGRLGERTIGNASSNALAATSLIGHWFSSKRQAPSEHGYKHVYPFNLSIKNPLVFEDLKDLSSDISSVIPEYFDDWEEVRDAIDVWVSDLKDKNYDGIIVKDDQEYGGSSFIAFDSSQIRAILPNSSSPQQGGLSSSATPTEEPFSLTAPEPSKAKAKEAGPEQLGIDIPPETIGSRPIIGREATLDEAPLFSKNAQTPDAEQTTLDETPAAQKEPWEISYKDLVASGVHAVRVKDGLWNVFGPGIDDLGLPYRVMTPTQAIKEYHSRRIIQAINEGKPVPPEVLADYPDLKPKEVAPSRAEVAPEQSQTAQSPTDILAAALRTAADQIEGKKIEDVGEKIGGARKDLAGKSEPKPEKPKPEGPAWERRYKVHQIVKSLRPEENGKWAIGDTKDTDFAGRPIPIGGLYDTEEAARAALPLLAVAKTHRVYQDRDGKWEIFKRSGDRKLIHVVNQKFDTEEDAMRYLAQNAADILEAKTFFGEEVLPRPETVQRVGTDRRNGRNVDANDFKETFGFRAVEFGNWQNQDDRQELMNHAFDGLHDLAETLNIPSRAVGLNGDLALAFGSRGHGLSGAAAHYERNYGVINLTKMQGAGHLAHEWFHAADHYFGRQDTKASSEKETNSRGDLVYKAKTPSQDYASHGFRMTGSKVRPEVREAYKSLIRTMFQKGEQYVEDAQRADKFVAQARERVAEQLESIRNSRYGGPSVKKEYGKQKTAPATAEQLAEFDAIAQRILEGETFEQRFQPSDMAKKSRRYAMAGRWTNDALEKISAIYKSVRGRSGFGSGDQKGVLDDLRHSMNFYKERLKMLADAQAGSEKTKQVPTSFAMEAKSMDQGRKEAYWATEHEMAARAFSAYVEDKLKADGKKSDFITYQTFGAVPTIWGFKKPYPEGTERKAINEAFDKFVGVLQTKETEKGIALYQKNANRPRGTESPLNGKTVDEALAVLQDEAPTESQKRIAAKVASRIKELQGSGLSFNLRTGELTGELNDDALGSVTFDTEIRTATIRLRNDSAYWHETALHEFVHAATMTALEVGADRIGTDSVYGKLRSDLDEIWETVREHIAARAMTGEELSPFEQQVYDGLNNALDSSHELIAWGMSSQEMQDLLSSIPSKEMTWWEKFVNAIRSFLGLPSAAHTALSEVLHVGEKILSAPAGELTSMMPESFIAEKRSRQTGTIDPPIARERLKESKSSLRPYLLGALGLEQMSQVYGKDHAEVRQYNKATQDMEADFTEMSRESDKVARAWTELKIPVADKMAMVMEDARFLNFDPDPRKKQEADSAKKRELVTRFEQLPDDAKAVYRMARDFYTNMAEQRFQALKERIERAGGTPENTRKLVDRLQIAYEQVRSKVYFPFTRFGENIVVAKQMKDGKEVDREVHAFESVAEAQKFATMMKLKGWQVKQTVAREYSVDKEGPASKIVRQMHDIIKELGQGEQGLPGVMNLEDQLLDSLNQSFLQALPDMSYAKHFIHAKDVKGASRDALRSFAHSALHGAHHISRIRHADQVTKALINLDDKINKTAEGDTTEARQVYNELVKRHNDIMNPNTHPFSAWLGQLGFTMSLGGVVATGITNATQVPLVTYPWLGARYGFGKASAALARAYKDFLNPRTLNKDSLFDASKSKLISESERKMLLELARRGRIDLTQTMDLAGLSSQDNLSRKARLTGTLNEKVTRMLGFTFHAPEVMNRQVTALSTFRLEKEKGGSFDEALQRAEQAIIDTHFLYQSFNRPRYMSGNFLRVLTMFKQYSQNIAYTYGRAASIWLDKNNATKEERTVAKRQLISMLALQFGAAGALGMPFFGSAADILMAVVGAFGDDDDKREWEVALRKWLDGTATSLAEAFIDDKETAGKVGKELAEVVSHGVSRLTPWDMAGRLGQNDLFFREPQREREGRQAVMDWMLALGGPVPSYGMNFLLGMGDVAKGVSELNAGFFMRGVEELTPAVIRHGVKSLRYTLEGVRTRDEYKQLELDTSEKLGQAFGFTPSKVAEMYESTTAVKNKEHRILNQRKALLDRFSRAVNDQDDSAKTRILEDIQGFNERNPIFGITSNTLNRSLKTRRQHEAGMERGLHLPPRRRALMEEGDWADF